MQFLCLDCKGPANDHVIFKESNVDIEFARPHFRECGFHLPNRSQLWVQLHRDSRFVIMECFSLRCNKQQSVRTASKIGKGKTSIFHHKNTLWDLVMWKEEGEKRVPRKIKKRFNKAVKNEADRLGLCSPQYKNAAFLREKHLLATCSFFWNAASQDPGRKGTARDAGRCYACPKAKLNMPKQFAKALQTASIYRASWRAGFGRHRLGWLWAALAWLKAFL